MWSAKVDWCVISADQPPGNKAAWYSTIVGFEHALYGSSSFSRFTLVGKRIYYVYLLYFLKVVWSTKKPLGNFFLEHPAEVALFYGVRWQKEYCQKNSDEKLL